jgi:hypothetical protein
MKKNIHGLQSKNLEHTGTNMSFKPFIYIKKIKNGKFVGFSKDVK